MSDDRGKHGQLVLTRSVGQGVVLCDKDVAQEVEIDSIIDGKVRLRFLPIDGARTMNVWRSEVWDEREKRGQNG